MTGFARSAIASILFAALLPVVARAAEVEFKPTGQPAGDLTSSLSVQRVAERDVSHGLVNIQDGTVQILASEGEYLNSSVVLSGKVVKTVVNGTSRKVDITGIIYFDGGQWLPSIDDPKAVDFAFIEGGFVRGHIAGFSADSVLMDKFGKREQIKLVDIKELRSPRVYTFTISALADRAATSDTPFRAQANEIALKETMPLRVLSPLSVNPRKDKDDLDLDMLDADDALPKSWPGLSPFQQLPTNSLRRYGAAGVDP